MRSSIDRHSVCPVSSASLPPHCGHVRSASASVRGCSTSGSVGCAFGPWPLGGAGVSRGPSSARDLLSEESPNNAPSREPLTRGPQHRDESRQIETFNPEAVRCHPRGSEPDLGRGLGAARESGAGAWRCDRSSSASFRWRPDAREPISDARRGRARTYAPSTSNITLPPR